MLAVELRVLASTNGGNVARNTGIDDYIFFTCIFIYQKTAQDLKAVAVVEFLGDLP